MSKVAKSSSCSFVILTIVVHQGLQQLLFTLLVPSFMRSSFNQIHRELYKQSSFIQSNMSSCHHEGAPQAGINCGPSSQSDFIQIYFLLKRMFRLFRHSRQMPYFNVSRLKVTHFNVLGQKVTYLNEMR